MLTIRNYNKIIYAAFFFTINSVLPIKNNFILIISLYNEQNPKRVKEYIECLERNQKHSLISKIHVIYDTKKDAAKESSFFKFLQSKDVTISTISGRPTFQYCFDLANELYPDSAIIVSNADIYFNETLYLLEEYDLTDKFLALTRWNVERDKSITPMLIKATGKPSNASQDTWIFRTPLRKFDTANIEIGTLYCDGRIAYEAQKVGLLTMNPCQSIQCCHLHLSKVRHYQFTKCTAPTAETASCLL